MNYTNPLARKGFLIPSHYLRRALGRGYAHRPTTLISPSTTAVPHKDAPRTPIALPRLRGATRFLLLLLSAAAIALEAAGTAHAYKLHVPCTTSHDCPRGAFCRHATSFRGQCVLLPQMPFGIFGARQVEFPPQSDPPEHIFGSMPILRCS
jgi:hypothetical protein